MVKGFSEVWQNNDGSMLEIRHQRYCTDDNGRLFVYCKIPNCCPEKDNMNSQENLEPKAKENSVVAMLKSIFGINYK